MASPSKVNLSFNYILIIPNLETNVKANLAFFLKTHGGGSRQYHIHTLSSLGEVMAHVLE